MISAKADLTKSAFDSSYWADFLFTLEAFIGFGFVFFKLLEKFVIVLFSLFLFDFLFLCFSFSFLVFFLVWLWLLFLLLFWLNFLFLWLLFYLFLGRWLISNKILKRITKLSSCDIFQLFLILLLNKELLVLYLLLFFKQPIFVFVFNFNHTFLFRNLRFNNLRFFIPYFNLFFVLTCFMIEIHLLCDFMDKFSLEIGSTMKNHRIIFNLFENLFIVLFEVFYLFLSVSFVDWRFWNNWGLVLFIVFLFLFLLRLIIISVIFIVIFFISNTLPKPDKRISLEFQSRNSFSMFFNPLH